MSPKWWRRSAFIGGASAIVPADTCSIPATPDRTGQQDHSDASLLAPIRFQRAATPARRQAPQRIFRTARWTGSATGYAGGGPLFAHHFGDAVHRLVLRFVVGAHQQLTQ